MTPTQLSKSNSEEAHQTAIFAYCAYAMANGFEEADKWAGLAPGKIEVDPSCLKWLHHIPNGGSRGDNAKSRAIRGGAMKAQGTKRGIPDLFLPLPNCGYHGLYIEMKKPSLKPKTKKSKGGLSNEQIEFKEYALSKHYGFVTCYSWKEAINILKEYIKFNT